VRKVRSDSFLRQSLIEQWIVGEGAAGLPVVVLSDLKSRAVARYPFDLLYQELWTELTDATTLVVAGYGFGDQPVNSMLERWSTRTRGSMEIWSRDGPRARERAIMQLGLDEDRSDGIVGYSVALPDPKAIAELADRIRGKSSTPVARAHPSRAPDRADGLISIGRTCGSPEAFS
jgi:hypothetical protein